MFAILDTLLERIGARLTGNLTWACSEHRYRLTVVIASIFYVLAHCIILMMQISTLHSAIDGGNEVLGLLASVKFSDIKDGFRSTHTTETMFRSALGDVATRFKWLIFLMLVKKQSNKGRKEGCMMDGEMW